MKGENEMRLCEEQMIAIIQLWLKESCTPLLDNTGIGLCKPKIVSVKQSRAGGTRSFLVHFEEKSK